MKKIVGFCEHPEDHDVLGIVISDVFREVAIPTLLKMGFSYNSTQDNLEIFYSKEFDTGMLNKFTQMSNLDYDYFKFFACKKEQLSSYLQTINEDEF